MGSMITLGIGKLEIDWGKNDLYKNHSCLFKSCDIKKIPYYYADGIVEHKEGLSRKLKDMKRRLELMGYHSLSLKSLYEKHLQELPDYYPDVPINFEDYFSVISNLDISKIEIGEQYEDYDPGEFLSKYLFKHPEFNKIHNLSDLVDDDIGYIFENIDPHLTLRILAENPQNLELEVYWGYLDVIESGWIEKDTILKQLGKGGEILIVTEGSSDTHIIKKVLSLLYQDIDDFFCFVDMEENYPFTGDGNLYNFCKGLSSIGIKNDTLIIFDNDVAGVSKYNLSIDLDTPKNMLIIKFPDHEEFRTFQTIGPNGKTNEDINGSAVAIECFLDHSFKVTDDPCVRWTSYY